MMAFLFIIWIISIVFALYLGVSVGQFWGAFLACIFFTFGMMSLAGIQKLSDDCEKERKRICKKSAKIISDDDD